MPSAPAKPALIDFRGEEYRYQVTLEPHQRNWIFALDLPASWDRRGITMNRDLQLISQRPVRRLTGYNVVSHTEFTADLSLPQRLVTRNLGIPANRNPKTQALARQMLAEAGHAELFISRVLQMFREQEFFYTLQPPRTGYKNSVDDFLFTTRQGFCGHYASAFTLMMRAAGIPARVVTGYQGGEYNRLGDYLVVRQADAHAWSEVWLPGRGWQRVDPTAAVAPDRILRGLAGTLPDAMSAQARFLRLHPALIQMRQAWDAMQNAWNEWILDYDLDRQRSLLEKLGFEKTDWKSRGAGMAVPSWPGVFGSSRLRSKGSLTRPSRKRPPSSRRSRGSRPGKTKSAPTFRCAREKQSVPSSSSTSPEGRGVAFRTTQIVMPSKKRRRSS